MRKYLIAGAGALALVGGSAVFAQDAPVVTDPVPPDMPAGADAPPPPDPMANTMPPAPPPASDMAPTVNVVSNPVTQPAPPPPADAEYPRCSKTVTDACKNRGAK